jgi:hypothetical protein
MTQTMVLPDPPIDSPCQYHGDKVTQVRSVYIESYHIDNVRSKLSMTDVTVNRLCVQKIKQQKLQVVQFTELQVT